MKVRYLKYKRHFSFEELSLMINPRGILAPDGAIDKAHDLECDFIEYDGDLYTYGENRLFKINRPLGGKSLSNFVKKLEVAQ
jgi:hypothetical protein